MSEEARVGVRSPGVVACVCCWRVPDRRTAMCDMSGNSIGAEGVAALAPVLGRLAQLTNLNLAREWVSVCCRCGVCRGRAVGISVCRAHDGVMGCYIYTRVCVGACVCMRACVCVLASM